MISFPNAKINLGLRVLRKREDGYHDIESCMYPVGWCDVLELVESDEEDLTISGLSIPGVLDENLCWKAYQLVSEKFPVPPVKLHLHKVIPMGAGIGGGSSNAAFTIKLLNDTFSLGMTPGEMENIARKLGSDCPFFIKNRPSLVSGTGTDLEEFPLEISPYHILMINPGIHISTAEAYGNVPLLESSSFKDLRDVLSGPIENWKNVLRNDFESYAFQKHPELSVLKQKLYEGGALYASMSGSGATMYGIFEEEKIKLDVASTYSTWQGSLKIHLH